MADVVPRRTVQLSVDDGVIDLSWGHPDPELLPVAAWRQAYAEALDRTGWTMLTYGYKAGPLALREWLAAHLATIDEHSPAVDDIVVTAGVSAGLELVATTLGRPGQVALVEAPTYYLAASILRDAGLDVIAVESDADGIDPQHVTARAEEVRSSGREIALLYVMPTFANPTGRSLPASRRRELLDVCAAQRITVVEDDTYRDLWYDDRPPPSLWSQSTTATVVRLGSFSKTVGPGLRLGYLVTDGDTVERIITTGVIASGGCLNHATAMAMGRFGSSGRFVEHTAFLREQLRTRRNSLVDALTNIVPTLTIDTRPRGGYFVWAHSPAPIEQLLPAARAAGVGVLPGDKCFTDGRSTRAIRLSFSMYSAAALRTAVERLGPAVDECRR